MALTGIYNSNDREIVLTPFQAQVFNATIEYFKTNGVGGDNVFEDTYVLQQRVAEYIKGNVTTGGGTAVSFVNQIYNGVLGITPVAPPPPPPPPPPPSGGDFSLPTDDTDSYTPDNNDVFTVNAAASSEVPTVSTSGGTTVSTSGAGPSAGEFA